MGFTSNFVKNSDKGNAILAVMLLAGVSAGVSANLSNVMNNSFESLNSARIKIEREGVAHMLGEDLDCKATLQYNGTAGGLLCNSAAKNGNIIDLKGANGASLGGAPVLGGWHNVSGSWRARARCQFANVTSRGLSVDIAKVNPDGSYQKDPLTNKDLYFPNFMHDTQANGRKSPCFPLFVEYSNCVGDDKLAKNFDFKDICS